MTGPETERQALALFEAMLDVPEGERQAWIEARTEGQPALRQRLEAMRDADLLSSLRTGGVTEVLADEAVPERIGAYKIIERIGRGGMGAVYRGERDAGDFHHVVAIKVIKPGVFSDALVERFQRERQTLAALSHPNIAQLYDGGATDGGSPYIVMEYVDGLPLIQWVEETKANIAERRRVFADICAAVGFAHRNLVVHRDLTPSNVLVSREGRVKLIDFGIARAPEARNLEEGVQASVASLSLTPGFAAPERMTNAGVALAADVYSLGKLLERLIPPGNDRELKAVVARATAPSPADRYTSAEALADDVAAWGEGRPVDAVGGGGGYRLAKFVGRYRLGVSAAAAALVLLVAALVVTLAANRRAEQALAAEEKRFGEVRSLAGYMLFDLAPQMERVIGNSAARTQLAERAQAYLSALARDAGDNVGLRLEVARGLVVLARNQGVPTEPNLGQPDRAEANLIEAGKLLSHKDLPVAEAAPVRAEALALLAMVQAHVKIDTEAGKKSADAAAKALESVPANARSDAWRLARSQLVKSQIELSVLGQEPDQIGKLADTLEREAAAWPAELRASRHAAIDRAVAAHYRGIRGYFTDELDASVASFEDAARQFRELEAALPNDPMVLMMRAYNSQFAYGAASGLEGRPDVAQDFLKDAADTSARLIAIEPNDRTLKGLAASIRGAQAQGLADLGRYPEAIALQTDVAGLYRAALGKERKTTTLNRLVIAELVLGNIAVRAKDRVLACAAYGRSVEAGAELERRKALLGFVEGRLPVVRANHGKCGSGASVGAMEEA